MTAAGLIASIILLFVALIALGFPFLQQRRNNTRSNSETQKKRDELLTSYERVLATIRDLDEDHQTGKIAAETYQQEREYWTEQGILLLQALEPDSDTPPETNKQSPDDVLDGAIEKAIAEYRGVKA